MRTKSGSETDGSEVEIGKIPPPSLKKPSLQRNVTEEGTVQISARFDELKKSPETSIGSLPEQNIPLAVQLSRSISFVKILSENPQMIKPNPLSWIEDDVRTPSPLSKESTSILALQYGSSESLDYKGAPSGPSNLKRDTGRSSFTLHCQLQPIPEVTESNLSSNLSRSWEALETGNQESGSSNGVVSPIK